MPHDTCLRITAFTSCAPAACIGGTFPLLKWQTP
jgi:hypothetical protein